MFDIVVGWTNSGVLDWQFLWSEHSIHVFIIAIALSWHGNGWSSWQAVVGYMTNLGLEVERKVS